MLGVAPYAGALNDTWFDRDLGIGGKVIVKQSDGKIATRLVKLGWPSEYTLPTYLTARIETDDNYSCQDTNVGPTLWATFLWAF